MSSARLPGSLWPFRSHRVAGGFASPGLARSVTVPGMRPLASVAVLLLAGTGPGAALAASDLDRDGLDDTSERQVVQRHLPWLRIDAGNLGAPGAGPLDAPHPAETRLGAGRWDQPSTNCAWPIAPHRRGVALVRSYPAAPYEPTGFMTQPVRYAQSADDAALEAQHSRLGYWIARVSLVFANDCGGTGKRVGRLSRGVNAHRGDTEAIVMSLVRDRRCLDPEHGGQTPGGDGYRVLEVIAQAHVGTSWARLPFESLERVRVDSCTYGAAFHPGLRGGELHGSGLRGSGEPGGGSPHHPSLLWPALWKHGLYLTRTDCEQGMRLPVIGALEQCTGEGFVQGFDVANVGEPGFPIDPDDPVNAPEERAAGRFAALFPGEDAWEVRRPSAPGRADGGFCGGYERTGVIAAGRRCMGDPIRHKLEGDLSDVGDAPLLGRRECPDGDLCHRLLLPRPPSAALQPAWITAIEPAAGPAAGGNPVVLSGGFPVQTGPTGPRHRLCALRFGAREADLASVAIEGVEPSGAGSAPRLRVKAPPGVAGSSVPIRLETCGGVTSLDTVPGSPGWYRYEAGS